MDLYKLMYKCINIPYLKVGESGNFAVRKMKDTLYIFFEGSNSETDWKDNLSFPAKPYKRMGRTTWYAHSGFLRAFKNIEDAISKDILSPEFKKIIITGFSHGGALATLCHEYAYYNRPDIRDNILGYGFGAPRVLWGIINKELKKRWDNFTVIRNIDDIVTHLPPYLLGYRHVGTLLEIGEKNKYGKVQAHLPENYLEELKIYQSNLTL